MLNKNILDTSQTVQARFVKGGKKIAFTDVKQLNHWPKPYPCDKFVRYLLLSDDFRVRNSNWKLKLVVIEPITVDDSKSRTLQTRCNVFTELHKQ